MVTHRSPWSTWSSAFSCNLRSISSLSRELRILHWRRWPAMEINCVIRVSMRSHLGASLPRRICRMFLKLIGVKFRYRTNKANIADLISMEDQWLRKRTIFCRQMEPVCQKRSDQPLIKALLMDWIWQPISTQTQSLSIVTRSCRERLSTRLDRSSLNLFSQMHSSLLRLSKSQVCILKQQLRHPENKYWKIHWARSKAHLWQNKSNLVLSIHPKL